MSDRALVILPTYNEAENIGPLVDRLRLSVPTADLLVVDDGSPDGTGGIADELARRDEAVHVLHRPGKSGLGAAYLHGFSWARQHGYGVVVECDADGSHHPEELERLLDAVRTADVVIGSRWVPGGAVEDWPVSRRTLSRAGSAYARAALHLPQHDVTSGYRAFRAAALDRIGLDGIQSEGYCFQIEMLWRANNAGLSIAEVPITFTDRRLGASKMRGRIVAEAMWRVTRWAWESRSHSPGRTSGEPRHA
ncbi:polyprenol monophosphomannose synthase [Microbacterium sp. SSW1-49]|uniref:Polyprenol monophosphomannose synthase n=1 Tax=Microbacterium croceum TaxID=2851645 RepID=A0ABT0FDH3_9MICO|nr:polyprenol monophosphomannose synthase [Microbacterium croceum]MCK2035744.1 polyprenol monophosphomannose synthase [Microbacterium croceum]